MTGARLFAALAGGVLAILAIGGFWLWRAMPVPMPDLPSTVLPAGTRAAAE